VSKDKNFRANNKTRKVENLDQAETTTYNVFESLKLLLFSWRWLQVRTCAALMLHTIWSRYFFA